jgi:hypothetical protein
MDNRSSRIVALAASLVIALLGGCALPASDPVELQAIRDEAQSLMALPSASLADAVGQIPISKWPPTIAKLKPESVTMYRWGVAVILKPGFDGGWGYDIPRSKRDLPMPESCYSEPYQGLFWHRPC